MKVVRLSALGTGRLYPQEMPVVLISVRDLVDPRAIERPVGISNRKTRIESTNFWLVAQCLKQPCHLVPHAKHILPQNYIY